MTKKGFAFFLCCLLFPAAFSHAYWVWSPESGKFVNPEGAVQDTAEEQYDYAMQFYKEKNLDEAANQLEGLLKKFPGARIAPEAQYRLGTIYEEKSDFQKAFKAYKVLLESYPQSERLNEAIEREYRIGNLFLSGKKGKLMGLEVLPSLPRAVEIFQHIVKHAPYSDFGAKAQFRLGLTYKKWNHFDEAVQAFQTLIEQYPKSELVPDARFQLAETSFMRSQTSYRDQRALDDAMGQIDHFLTRHADAGATSEKAAKLRQEIDEKNAEKNYRIGLYYEKENYLSSALIYYGDVASRYPHTRWGDKAQAKLKTLKEPADYLNAQEKEIRQEIEITNAKLKGVTDDSLERDRLKRQMERLKQRQKSLEQNKSESIKRRKDDLKRREREWKDKYKKLEKRKKLLKKNPSEDFKRAIDRWSASLQAEKEAFSEEKEQLATWGEELGLRKKNLNLEMLPFMGEAPSELEKVRRVEAKKLYKVAGEKKTLLEEKEVLYKQHGEVATLLEEFEAKRLGLAEEEKEWSSVLETAGGELKSRHEKIKIAREEIKRLEEELRKKRSLYEKRFGIPRWLGWVTTPTGTVARSTAGIVTKSLDILNPFDSSGRLTDKNLEELLERRMHLKEKIAAQRNLTETLTQAFDAELALQEQKRLLESLEQTEKIDPHELRKSIKKLEKDIRSRYEEIEDRHKRVQKLLEELEGLTRQTQKTRRLPSAARAITAPALGFARLTKAFVVGLPNKDVEITQSASSLKADAATAETAQRLKEEIELESLLIDGKNREIVNLQRELEIMRAKASLAGGFKFRSAFVKVPYLFIGEAIESANRLVPKKNRQEVLIQRLDRETRELEVFKQELKNMEAVIEKKTSGAGSAAVPIPQPGMMLPPTAGTEDSPAKDTSEEAALRAEIQQMTERLEIQEKSYRQEKAVLESELETLSEEAGAARKDKGWARQQKQFGAREEKLRKELKGLQGDLAKIIRKESELEGEESKILEKRIQKIDTVIQKVHSKALSQDLLTERQRMEDRLSQLESRRSFLVKELERFQLPESAKA